MDYHQAVEQQAKMQEAARMLREAAGDIPILATFRSKKEGGEKQLATADYITLNKMIIETAMIDLIDVELFTGEEFVRELVVAAHHRGIKVVMSNHDFFKTPDKEEIINRLCRMQEMGADLPKIAVMPQNTDDVLTLLSATNEMMTKYADRPIITMSMKGMGVISRLTGEVFGSAITFGAAGMVSAPGQLAVEQLADGLAMIHESMK